MDVFVETDRLVLRRFTADDLELLVELDSIRRSSATSTAVLRSSGRTCRDVVVVAQLLRPIRGIRVLGRGRESTGVFLGWFHLRPGEGAGPLEPELGYRLRRQVWGRGFATEGSRALIDKAFAELGVDRVYASTMAVNTASRRVMEKAGLRYVRTFHSTGPSRSRRRARRCGVRHRPDAMGEAHRGESADPVDGPRVSTSQFPPRPTRYLQPAALSSLTSTHVASVATEASISDNDADMGGMRRRPRRRYVASFRVDGAR